MKKALIWIFAILITIFAAIFQRMTGPTHPKKVNYKIDNVEYSVKLPRSGDSDKDCKIQLTLPKNTSATVFFRRFPTTDDFNSLDFRMDKDGIAIVYLPKMRAAAKLEYYIKINTTNENVLLQKTDPVIIRFKDPVPIWALIPHIFVMFFAMLLSNVAGLMALFRIKSYRTNGLIALVLLLAGGFVLGPIVQYFAFGQGWTGFPLGSDLTDNKTLIAFVVWLIAVILNWKKDKRLAIILASIITIVVFSIPHSMRGSELDYKSGKIVTGGFIQTSNIPIK